MAGTTNFINRSGRTYLVQNPNNFGEGVDLGYYRETLFGTVQAVALKPYDEQEFETVEDAQTWLKQKAGL